MTNAATTAFTIPISVAAEPTSFQPALRNLGSPTPHTLAPTTTAQIESALRVAGIAQKIFSEVKKECAAGLLLRDLGTKNESDIRKEATTKLQELYTKELANPTLRSVVAEFIRGEQRLGAESAVRDALHRVSDPTLKSLIDSLKLTRGETMAITVVLNEALREIIEKSSLSMVSDISRNERIVSHPRLAASSLPRMESFSTADESRSTTAKPASPGVTVPKGKIIAFAA